MRIALDAMGSDRHPEVEVQGAVAALREVGGDFQVVLVGDRARIEAALAAADAGPVAARISVVHASEVIEPGESVSAIRKKKDSSIVVGLGLCKQGHADAFVSAGSTGAVMAASLLLLRPLPGVDRPSVATILPTAGDPIIMLDAGANVDSKPYHLVDWARLGAIYAEDVLQRANPRVALLNIGEEPEKGNELAVETYRLLEQTDLNFVGNVEGRDIVVGGACDVLVTDGFAGNVLLKFYESVAGLMVRLLRKELSAQNADVHLDRVFKLLDYTEYGGAPLLGIDGISIICHGGSPPRAIASALRVAGRAYDTGMVADMKRILSEAHAAEAAGTPGAGNA